MTPHSIPNPEIALLAISLIVALLASRFQMGWLGWWERPLQRMAPRKRLAIVIAGIVPLAVRAALLPLFPIPEPRVHDEFTLLFGADTFLHGRVANPQHPFWYHFQSPHILSRPTWASAFPMAQSAVLAIGKLLGHPWIGVWLSAGVMCAAICWMLQGWVTPRWALFGAALAILRFGISSYWMNSYWGGCAAAIGGALVLGAIPRFIRQPVWRRAMPLAIGLAILANSRPVEGAVFGFVAMMALAWMIFERGFAGRVVLRELVIPLTVVLGITAIGMGYTFARITGKPWVVPYALYRDTVTMAPHFIWQSPTPEPMFSSRELREFYTNWELSSYQNAQGWRGLRSRFNTYRLFYFGQLLAIPLIAALFLWRNRKTRWLLLIGAGSSLALWGQVWHLAHYAAPATGVAVLLIVQGLRALRQWRGSFGLALFRCLPVACAVMLIIQIVLPTERGIDSSWRWPTPGGVARARVNRELLNSGKKQLVFVRYATGHDPGDEWVYNDADVDHARIVWARELDPASNAKLMRYFAGRETWLIEPDQAAPTLVPYAAAPFRPMKFVQLNAPGIDVLQSDEVKRRILEKAANQSELSCDGWNYYFINTTGVEAPESVSCFGGHDRPRPISFDHWFDWLQRQR